jgi:hypothetical protein
MDIHENARLTPILREELAEKVVLQGVTPRPPPSGQAASGSRGVPACRTVRRARWAPRAAAAASKWIRWSGGAANAGPACASP